jgi:hypothetical protein
MASLLAAKQCDQIRHNFQIWEKLSQLTKVKDNFSHFLFLKNGSWGAAVAQR